MEKAMKILEQLGGNKFLAMTGAKNLVGGDNHLQMRLGRNDSKANILRITVEPTDTYKIEFMRLRNYEVKTVKEIAGVYCDQLQSIFTRETGLRTAL